MIAFCVCLPTFAQFPVTSSNAGNGDIKIKYVTPTDSTVLVYAVYTCSGISTDNGPMSIYLDRSLHVETDDMDYRLLNAFNIPIYDEARGEKALLFRNGEKLNFIMEFEVFPYDAPFSIVERNDGMSFNVSDVVVDTSSVAKVNTKRFLNSTPCLKGGSFADEGHLYSYYEQDGFFIAAYGIYSDTYQTVYMTIINNSDHGVMLNTFSSKFKGFGTMKNGNKVEMTPLTKSEYESVLADHYRYVAENSTYGNKGLSILDNALFFTGIDLEYRSWGRAGVEVARALVDDAQRENTKPYLNELAKSRAARIGNYLQSQSLKAGESYSGYMKFKRSRKCKLFELEVTIDGRTFPFAWSSPD